MEGGKGSWMAERFSPVSHLLGKGHGYSGLDGGNVYEFEGGSVYDFDFAV